MKDSDNLQVWNLIRQLAMANSLTKAAISADLELSAASRLIKSFEKELGIQLLDRTGRPVQLQSKYREVLPLVNEMMENHRILKDLLQKISQDSGTLSIRLSVPSNIERGRTIALIEEYREIDPLVSVELFANLDHMDVLNDKVDIAFLPYNPTSSGLYVVPTLKGTTFLFASPEYLRKFGAPKRVEDLCRHTLILRNGPFYPVTQYLYSLEESFNLRTGVLKALPHSLLSQKSFSSASQNAEAESEAKRPKVSSDGRSKAVGKREGAVHIVYGDTLSCLQMMLEGVGIAVDISLGFMEPYLKSGRAVPILPQWHRPLWDNTVATKESNIQRRQIIDFMHWYAHKEKEAGNACWKRIYQDYGQDPQKVLALNLQVRKALRNFPKAKHRLTKDFLTAFSRRLEFKG